jgi:hypothetical protein
MTSDIMISPKIAEKRETESRLTAERQDRLAISDKLSEALKVSIFARAGRGKC